MFNQLEFAEPITAAVLFGSQARGDAVAGSDVDIAVFADVKSVSELLLIKSELGRQCAPDSMINFSVYSTSTAKIMAHEGSLYLWHLKTEGRPLVDHDFLGPLFSGLSPYTKRKASEDVETFARVVRDMSEALDSSEDTLEFEAATAFSILRSIGMMLAALGGRFVFSRVGPVEYLKEEFRDRFPFDEADVCKLLRAKLSYSGKSGDSMTLSAGECRQSVSRLRALIEITREKLK
jgi:Polymerase beta, Nucleotidyltransferase